MLQYLPDAAAERALANFGRLCRGVLYFSALTRYDYERNCDQARTDADVHLRSAHWYRTRLRRRFRALGLGSGCGVARRLRSGTWSCPIHGTNEHPASHSARSRIFTSRYAA